MTQSFNMLKERLPAESKNKIEERLNVALQEMLLAELRQAGKFTQRQLAKSLKIKQASVSRMESQTDMYLSTIRKYIEAMGGEFEIVAKFPEGSIRVGKFKELNTSPTIPDEQSIQQTLI
ncbi:MAG: helix-turn-helix domain-containing protein [Desulforhopalus sp.]|nr:helix-turn-helix domain-containing protein [Desulforhopalus sp.]